jgi:hypothetical protein
MSATERELSARTTLAVIGHQQRYVLAPMLNALALLADSQRVLEEFNEFVIIDPGFGQAMTKACPTWSNPLVGAQAYEAIYDLTLAAHALAVDIGGQLDRLEIPAPVFMRSAAKGGRS